MKTKIQHRTKGQSMVEYSIIAAAVILALIIASRGIGLLMKNQVDSTAKGLSSGSYVTHP
jgi:uncharacterized protein (UPF0333 family)